MVGWSGDAKAQLDALVLRARRGLRESYGREGAGVRVVVSPYRICPIGAHVDHQEGPVLGMAISAYTALAFAASDGAQLRARSASFPGEACVDLRAPAVGDATGWTRYPRGAAAALADRLPQAPVGLSAYVAGSLPGGGLSSSASLLLAFLCALSHANGVGLGAAELVRRSRRAENDFVGLSSGILDPASIVGARRGHLLAIDTRAECWTPVPLGGGAAPAQFLVAYSGISRSLSGTGFNARVDECRRAAAELGRRAGVPEPRVLGDLDDAAFDAHLDALPGPLARRARHFRGERARVRTGAAYWRAGDLAAFGRLMDESCRSSIECYECGSPELVRLHEILRATPGVLGSRFSGGGYGGCCVALVEAARAETARAAAEHAFVDAHPALAGRARAFAVEGEDGLRVL